MKHFPYKMFERFLRELGTEIVMDPEHGRVIVWHQPDGSFEKYKMTCTKKKLIMEVLDVLDKHDVPFPPLVLVNYLKWKEEQ